MSKMYAKGDLTRS